MDKFWKWLSLIFVGFIFLAVLTHAYGFSLAAGTLFKGTNNLGATLSGRGVSRGSAPPKAA